MYDAFSQDYDRFVNWENRLRTEIPFLKATILKEIHKESSLINVLDAATGTGMHAIALACEGFEVCGSDLSKGMIEKARDNARRQNMDVRFFKAGFGELSAVLQRPDDKLPSRFDVLLCLGNSLPHVEGEADLLAALRDFASCLVPGGLLILQNRNFDSVLTARERWMEPQSYREAASEWVFLRFYDFLPGGHVQFNILTLKREGEEGWKQSVMETRLLPLPFSLMYRALSSAGFHQIKAFGALADVPFEPQKSGNLVLTAKKE